MRIRQPYLWILLAGLLLYVPSAFFGLSYLDDNILIVDNRAFLSSLSNIPRAFGQDVFRVLREYAVAYRPLLTVSFMIDARLDALFRSGYHLSNVVFHLIASCLVFLLFIRLKYARALALFFALVFTVHPALVQAVAWIPGRNDLLLGIFILLGFISFLDFVARKRPASLAAHLVFFTLALFTKEAAAVVPVVCAGYLFLVARERNVSEDGKRLFAGWCFALALWLSFRAYALSLNPVTIPAVFIVRDLAQGAKAALGYLGKALFPFNLSIIPTVEDTGIAYGVAAVAAVTFALAVSKTKRYGHILFGALWFAAFLAPTFVRPVAGVSAIFLESRLYLPIIGIFLVLGETAVFGDFAERKQKLFAGAAVIGLFFILSADHECNFKDAYVFWRCAAERSPHSSMAQYNFGWVYDRQGDLKRAEQQYLLSLALNPRQRYAHNSLGTLYERKGLLGRAEEEYLKEIKNTPYSETAYRNLENLYRRQGKNEAVIGALVPKKP